MFSINSNEGYFLHLVSTALKGTQPVEVPQGVDLATVFELSSRNDVENLTFLSVQKLNNKPQHDLYTQWEQAYYFRQKACLFQDMALEELISSFCSAGIDCMPLKGSVIKKYYPNPDLRTMSDIDFLVNTNDRQCVRQIMHNLGYTDDLLDDGQVDAFKRDALEYIEVHYDFSATNHAHHDLFTINWGNLVQTDTPHLYAMTFEDLYYFNIGHYAKNMHNKGMGIRAILDSYVLWNAATPALRDKINAMFSKTELADFNAKILKIADIWFNGADDDGTLDNVQKYLLIKKTYGDYKTETTLRALYANQTSSNSKFILSKIFPPPSALYTRFNIKHKCFLILPFLWIYRIMLQLFGNKDKWDKAKLQLNTFETVEQADIDYERSIRQEFGLM